MKKLLLIIVGVLIAIITLFLSKPSYGLSTTHVEKNEMGPVELDRVGGVESLSVLSDFLRLSCITDEPLPISLAYNH
jgi:hypothetical protein